MTSADSGRGWQTWFGSEIIDVNPKLSVHGTCEDKSQHKRMKNHSTSRENNKEHLFSRFSFLPGIYIVFSLALQRAMPILVSV